MNIITLDNVQDNLWTVPNPEVLEGAMLSWDGTGGVAGENAYVQFEYGGQVIYNKAIPFKDGRSLEFQQLACFTSEITIRTDKPGCILVFYTKNLGSDFSQGK